MEQSETTIYTEYETAASESENSTFNFKDFGVSIRVDALGIFQIILLTVGVIGNILILVVLRQGKGHLQPVTLTLVKHQSEIDAFVCVTLTVHIVIPKFWVS